MKIRISANGKTKVIDVSDITHAKLAITKVFFNPSTPVKMGTYTFSISQIDPWPKLDTPKNIKLF